MKTFLLITFLTFYLRILGWTSKIKFIYEGQRPTRPLIYIFWHSRLLLLAYSHRGRGITILVSTSRDGDVSAGVNKKLGYRIIRGTASSPTEARRSTIKILRELKKKSAVAITPDGPRGPAGKVKKGTPFLARKAGCAIVPVSWGVKRKVVLNTWDRFVLPLPFNRGVVLTGKPIYVKKDESLEGWTEKLEKILNELTRKADRLTREL